MSQVPTAVAVPRPASPAAPAVAAATVGGAGGEGGGGAAAAAAAQQQLYGYTAEQLAAWRPKFKARVEGHVTTSRSLMEPSKAQNIKALLRDWDSLDRKEKNTMSGGNADYWHRTYILMRKVSLKHQGFIVCQCSIPVLSRRRRRPKTWAGRTGRGLRPLRPALDGAQIGALSAVSRGNCSNLSQREQSLPQHRRLRSSPCCLFLSKPIT